MNKLWHILTTDYNSALKIYDQAIKNYERKDTQYYVKEVSEKSTYWMIATI
jgi:hypothetical protein